MDAMRAQSIPNGNNSYTSTRQHLIACHRYFFPRFIGASFATKMLHFCAEKAYMTVRFESGGSTYDTTQPQQQSTINTTTTLKVLVKYFEAQSTYIPHANIVEAA